ncbi:hypothetical protein [Isoptericola sp. BMS4]|uniref:hypothetical protein n=1 Tax=Isoptericola sp. BMS4 TaxID=2527875 RepID=UPI0014225CBC|nr:hypothetical protein [Isoptericola sp. BMS4]
MTAARWTSLGAVAAAFALLLFPVLRPWPDESVPSLALAAEFASDRWVLAHLCGIAGLWLLAPTFLGLRALLGGRAAPGARAAGAAVVTAWAGTVLCTLYYGAEAFGIHTIARASLRAGNPSLLADVDALRDQPAALALFGVGLALVAASGVLVAVAMWRGGTVPRWSGVPLAASLVLYLPQFFGGPGLRVAHGLLACLGLVLVASAAARLPAGRTTRATGGAPGTTTAGHPEE